MAKDKQIARLLKADISMTSNLADIAKMLEKKGRGGDTILAHITRREAEMLKEMGGAGTVNPETGLLEFYDGESEFTPTEFAAPVSDGSSVQAEVPAPEIPSGGFPGEIPSTPTSPQFYEPYITSGVQAQPAITAGMGPVQEQEGFGVAGTGVTGRPTTVAPAPNFLKQLTDKLGTEQLLRLGLAGAGGVYGAVQARKGAQQAEALKAEQQALAAPYQAQGREMVRAAQAGELTPTGQQAMQAFQARLAQGVEARGGVGAAQASAQAEAFRQQMLQQQYDYGLKVSSIGDQIALGAIKTGMQADQALQQASGNFYTQLASIAAGIPMGQTQQTPRA